MIVDYGYRLLNVHPAMVLPGDLVQLVRGSGVWRVVGHVDNLGRGLFRVFTTDGELDVLSGLRAVQVIRLDKPRPRIGRAAYAVAKALRVRDAVLGGGWRAEAVLVASDRTATVLPHVRPVCGTRPSPHAIFREAYSRTRAEWAAQCEAADAAMGDPNP